MRPTDTELAILRILWDGGPSTVREVYQQLRHDRDVGYTTALKMLQVMTAKGLVIRQAKTRSHVYQARYSEAQTQRSLVKDLLARAFGGSTQKLMLQALDLAKTSPKELAEIQKLLDQHKEPS